MDVREQITALREQLRYHNEKYYNEDAPEITDYEYDMLQRQLRTLEAEHPEMADANSPTQRVGGTASSRFAKVTHAYPLESLQDVFSFDELGEFYSRVENAVGQAEYVVEYKIDGLSVALEYVDGEFVRGATRGDGQVGEDVTKNLKTIKDIPKKLENAPPHLIVRGEVYMKKSVFDALNAELERKAAPRQSAQRGGGFSAAEGQQNYAGKKAVHLLLQHPEQRRAADGKPCAGARLPQEPWFPDKPALSGLHRPGGRTARNREHGRDPR